MIYTHKIPSTPPGASHRLRFWLKTPHFQHHPSSRSSYPAEHPSYLYQRLWKSDDFKIGAHLGFESVGDKIVLATRQLDEPPTFESTLMPLVPNRRRVSRLAPNVGVDDTGESVNDR
ncbi:hypothetical protein J3R82DRAFT_4751 [Butyriboletus roseoflavus]|nr:hypothetical protein J3R82DRAFT_4751 [Butyriboletus roseoflavus]